MSTLGDFFTLQRGNTYKSALLEQPGPFLLGLGTIQRNGGFKGDKLKTYGGTSDPRMLVFPGDIYVSLKDVTQSADLLGAVARVPDDVPLGRMTQDTVKLEFYENAPKQYIYWLLRTPMYREYCRAHATGTTNLGLPREDFLNFPVPDFTPERENVVNLLEGIENKIELNRRTNETLEAMAQAIFKDWFVDFGPVRRKIEGATDPAAILGGLLPPDSPNAKDIATLFPEGFGDNGLPEGWKPGKLGDIAKQAGETTTPDKVSSDTPYIGLEHMPRGSIALADWETAAKVSSNKARFKRGNVLFGKLRPYFHKVGIAPLDGICSTDIVVLHGKIPTFDAIVASLCSSADFVTYTDQTSTGTKMPRTSWKVMKEFEIALPPETLVRAYSSIVSPMHDWIASHIHASKRLAETRDYLLPKLMSGEIRACDIENLVAL